jgi:alpha-1,6-mannosyltransferase
LGLLGAILLLLGGLGAGGVPVHDPLLSDSWLAGWRYGYGRGVAIALGHLGLAFLVAAWVQLGRHVRLRHVGRRTVLTTAMVWMLPMLFTPPLFTRDAFSYLAQGAVALAGLDPYISGPAVLGGPLTDNVHSLWRETPSPYGPLFILLAKAVAAVSGDHVMLGVLLLRLAMLPGLVLLCWALPRLVRHLDGHEPLAQWVVVANPLTVAHLVGGVHNELLLVGLVAAGLALLLDGRPALGALLIAAACAVKLIAVLVLPFVVAAWAARLNGSLGWVRASMRVFSILVATFLVSSLLAGVGLHSLLTLWVPLRGGTWYSIPIVAATCARKVAMWFGASGTGPYLEVARLCCLVALGALIARQLLATRRNAPAAVQGSGVALAASALLAPVLHPWYALWGAGTLAAARWTTASLSFATALSVVLLPIDRLDGKQLLEPFTLIGAVAAALLAVAWLHSPPITDGK